MSAQRWMIYGCYGYTGELIVLEALAKGHKPVLAGRNSERTQRLAESHGLAWRAFDVANAEGQLDDVDVLINCAGPFSETASPMMQACLLSKTHYLDITGEIPVFQHAKSLNDQASKRGVVVCPGLGFDIVPTDMLAANLAHALPDASELELAFDFGALPSQGTARTAVKAIPAGGMVRRGGVLTSVPLGYRIRKVAFPRGTQSAVSFPWGDVFTAKHSTGIGNTIVYFAMPAALCWSQKLTHPLRGLLGTRPMQKALLKLVAWLLPAGPSQATRANAGTQFWGRVVNQQGREVSATLTAPSVYLMTAQCAVAAAEHFELATPAAGYHTASTLLGRDFLHERDGYSMHIKT